MQVTGNVQPTTLLTTSPTRAAMIIRPFIDPFEFQQFTIQVLGGLRMQVSISGS
ncbi:hypothetical protein WUBG_06214 [Wuchereria bancrofti]|uniref:Uncharacterized protein n=1 Tax=Wuchereria bancrofti TaxID=6293 RepID=J9B754_WUCBA|nr:hypothetical protein WUBG_06214 [Wuchereria bancrofti]